MDKTTREALRTGWLGEEQIYRRGPEAVIFALLEEAKQLAEARGLQTTPSTPSGMIPVYEKPAAKSRKKQQGAKKGHTGSR